MDKSLSLVLPVKNGSEDLEKRIQQLLDILPELTHQFEIRVVDDGSTDETLEVAQDLARQYPQVRFQSHNESKGILRAVESAIACTKADNIIIQSQAEPISAARIKNEWQAGNGGEPERPVLKPHEEDELIKKLEAWCDALKKNKSRPKTNQMPRPKSAGRVVSSLPKPVINP